MTIPFSPKKSYAHLMENEEQWRPVVGFEGLYSVSDQGRVRSEVKRFSHKGSKSEARILTPEILSKKPYRRVCLTVDGKRTRVLVHRLVLEAFVGSPPFEGAEGCHNDNDPGHNALVNLRWDSRKGNQGDRPRHGTDNRGERGGQAKLTWKEVREIRASRLSSPEAAEIYGVSFWQIKSIRANKYWVER